MITREMIKQASQKHGIGLKTMSDRINSGDSIDEAVAKGRRRYTAGEVKRDEVFSIDLAFDRTCKRLIGTSHNTGRLCSVVE